MPSQSKYVFTKEDLVEDSVFSQMAEVISKKARISSDVVKICAYRSFEEWENSHRQNVAALFYERYDRKAQGVREMVDLFKSKLRPIVRSEKRLRQTHDMIYKTFNRLFWL